ncbi:hypothetical protein WJX74_008777 [Apatococcus lobatus]|uniref:SGNH/GDSL hydrolase family protein n=1 Tax=Apatococcus lobatus TaxID=904363 RepID=A0AAW1RH69_9CHLO
MPATGSQPLSSSPRLGTPGTLWSSTYCFWSRASLGASCHTRRPDRSKGMALCRYALLAAVLGLAAHSAHAQDTRQRLIVFGDGLADNGNGGAQLYARGLTGNDTLAFPPSPYLPGRFTNGYVMPEYLAQYLDLQLFDFAIAGATSGATSSFFQIQNNTVGVPNNITTPRNVNVPSVFNQVTNYVNITSSISANDFYALIVGSNDYYDILAGANTTVAQVVGRIQQSAATLYGSGVRKLVIAEVPPLQATPFAQAQSAGVRTQLTNLVTQHNSQLSTAVSSLSRQYPQGTFAIIPVYTMVNSIASNPTRYGYTNATTQCYGTVSQPIGTGGLSVCSDPGAHIFWDRLNPTTNVHQQIAATAAREIAFTAGVPAMAPAVQALPVQLSVHGHLDQSTPQEALSGKLALLHKRGKVERAYKGVQIAREPSADCPFCTKI